MERKITVQESIVVSEKVDNFVRRYWPVALAAVGVAGAIGAAVWLTVRYIRERQAQDEHVDDALANLEDEALSTKDGQALLLECGSYLAQISGVEAVKAARELAGGVPDAESSEIIETLGGIADVELKNKH